MIEQAKQRAHAEVVDAIVGAARAQLAEVGAAALSVRRVARELGMASSAIYRYVRSRDDLLTLLIIRAYDDLGDHVAASVPPDGAPTDRWVAAARSVRDWAVAHPHEHALLYGSPVPGYAAPDDTIAPGSRVIAILAGIVADAPRPAVEDPADPALVTQLDAIADDFDLPVDAGTVARMIAAWSQLFGLVSLEVFGQLQNTDIDGDALLAETARGMAQHLGLADSPG